MTASRVDGRTGRGMFRKGGAGFGRPIPTPPTRAPWSNLGLAVKLNQPRGCHYFAAPSYRPNMSAIAAMISPTVQRAHAASISVGISFPPSHRAAPLFMKPHGVALPEGASAAPYWGRRNSRCGDQKSEEEGLASVGFSLRCVWVPGRFIDKLQDDHNFGEGGAAMEQPANLLAQYEAGSLTRHELLLRLCQAVTQQPPEQIAPALPTDVLGEVRPGR